MKKEIKIYWLIPIIIISGIFGFLTNSFEFFNFKSEIDLVNLFTLVVTSSLGFYIASTLQNNIEVKKFEKELVYSTIKSLNNKTKNIEKYLSANSLKFNETIKTFKDISGLISELKEVNEFCLVVDNHSIKVLRSIYIEIKPLITGGRVDNNNLTLSSEHIKLSKSKLKKFKNRLIKIMIEVNRK